MGTVPDQKMSLSNQLLIAMPNMGDPNFEQTVTYICEHNENGAIGIVINKPLTISLYDVLGQMKIKGTSQRISSMPVLAGGPVQQERGFVIHHELGKWHSSSQASEEIYITTSKDILEAIANDEGPDNVLVSLGYAGWGAGQLEAEMMKNCWLNGPANEDILFHLPFNERWRAAAKLLGIDMSLLSGDIGHA